MKTKVNPPKRKTNVSANVSGNVIRIILREELRNLESNIDRRFVAFEEKVDRRFVAFEEKVDRRFVAFEEKVDFKLDFKLGDLETRTDERAKKYRDQILTSNDKLMKELEEHRQDREIGDFQTKKKLDDYGKRIKILELA